MNSDEKDGDVQRYDEVVVPGAVSPGVQAAAPLVEEIATALERLTSAAADADHALRDDRCAPTDATMAAFFLDRTLSEARQLAQTARAALRAAQRRGQ
ncbi:hypothetical protein [Allokutzneria albata]|uniref:Uncharacterized protein n=1 Tax=Allokutzneria albata TaxID=211114 RepID=A0A1G9QUN4_ALLAB|nr:hypothetical protein [Allokutzneria albata]SDM14732.1 hypothetical protein SAMN04489726_0013 [Allokutzneria albata]SDN74318.1 hypothetical protein SAMN04489726_8024 [Allokutzneria albata]